MDDTRWQQLQFWFEEALKLPDSERSAFLHANCTEFLGMAEEVLQLLEADSREESLLSGLALPADGLEAFLNPREGEVVGPYQIERLLGRGGMGAVYLANRIDGEFEQQVAVKLLKRGMDSDELLHRFRTERQIQARLTHPNIARLLDGGLSTSGQPYFTMEYVEGLPLDQYVSQNAVPIRERLQLFLEVCRAIQYAHGQLVIHRDIKPSNIMVSESGTVKLLDFGIARLLDVDPDEGFTRPGNRVYTPEYASPEQAQGKPVGIATDIYSLGVILYELLCGERPYDLRDLSPAQREQVISERRPQLPSQRLPERSRILRGDLDTICLKALRKEPDRRYGTVGELADDLRRYLAQLPVMARRDSLAYRSRKFFQRNRIPVVAGALVVMLLIGLSSIYTWRLGQERDRARAEADKAWQVTEFLRGIFEENNPIVNEGDTLTALELLDRGAARIETELAHQPELKQEMLALMGDLYQEMGYAEQGRTLYGEAMEVQWASAEQIAASRADILGRYAKLEVTNGYPQRADSLTKLGIALRKQQELPEDEGLASIYGFRGEAFLAMRQLDSAEYYFTASLELYEQLHEPPHTQLASSLQSMGALYSAKFDSDRAADYFRRSITMFEQVEEAEGIPFRRPMLLHSMGMVLFRGGELDSAAYYFDTGIALFRQMYGNQHPLLGNMLRSKSQLHADASQFEEAKACLDESLQIYRDQYGEQHARVATVLSELGTLRSDQGDYAGAEAYYRKALVIQLKTGHMQSLATLYSNLGGAVEEQGNLEEAEGYYLECLKIDQQLHGNVHPYIADDFNKLGDLMEDMGSTEKAIAYYRQALALVDSGLPSNNRYIATTCLVLGETLDKQFPADSAMALILQGLKAREEILPPTSAHISTGQRILAEAYIRRQQYDRADSLLQISIANLEETLGEEHPATQSAYSAVKKLAAARKPTN